MGSIFRSTLFGAAFPVWKTSYGFGHSYIVPYKLGLVIYSSLSAAGWREFLCDRSLVCFAEITSFLALCAYVQVKEHPYTLFLQTSVAVISKYLWYLLCFDSQGKELFKCYRAQTVRAMLLFVGMALAVPDVVIRAKNSNCLYSPSLNDRWPLLLRSGQ